MKNIIKKWELISKYLFLLFPFFLAIFGSTLQIHTFGGVKTFFFIGLVSLAVIIYASYLLLKKQDTKITLSRIDLYLFLFIIGLTITSIIGVDPYLSFFGTFDRSVTVILWYSVFAYYLLLKQLLAKDGSGEYIVHYGIVAAGLFNVVGIWVSAIQDTPSIFNAGLEGSSSLSGVIVLFSFVSCLILINKYYTEKKFNILYLLTIALVFITLNPLFVVISKSGISLGQSRGVVLSMILSIIPTFGFFLLKNSEKTKRIIGRCILAVFVGITIVLAIMLFQNSSFPKKIFINNSGGDRLVFWDIAFKSIKENPLTGKGTETFEYTFFKKFNPVSFGNSYHKGDTSVGWADKPHNAYIEILHDNGIVVFIIYILVLVYAYREIFFMLPNKEKSRKAVLYFFLLTAYLFQNTLVFDSATSILLFLVLIALIFKGVRPVVNSTISRKVFWMVIPLCLFVIYQFSILPSIEGQKFAKLLRTVPFGEKGVYAENTFPISHAGGIIFSGYTTNRLMNVLEANPSIDYSYDVRGFISAIENEPNADISIPAHLFLARGYLYLYARNQSPLDLEKGKMNANYILEASPLYPDGYWNMAYAYFLEGNYKNALIELKTIIFIDPQLVSSYDKLILVANALGDKKLEQVTREQRQSLINK
jgi:O-antigen ligase